ncbi:MAG: LytTR family transcriptional regulator DNA-binding domain-containing protein [Bacteroidales bacterium]|nr:LytTR family transcriptional regulator DNA-binding domain-containing protein [Bacteroidales bacterium]
MKNSWVKKSVVISLVWILILTLFPAILIDWSQIDGFAEACLEVLRLWIRIAPFLILFLLHHCLILRLFPLRKKAYILCFIAALIAFSAWIVFDPMRPRHPGPPPSMEARPTPPPDMETRPTPPPDRGPRPDRPDGPPEKRRPFGPEASLILLGALMLVADRYGTTYLRGKTAGPSDAEQMEDLFFMSDYHRVRVRIDDILYIQSMGEYIKIYRESESLPLITIYSLSRVYAQLPADRFVRIHRSYIVARNAIEKHSRREVVLKNGVSLPIGDKYKES